MKITGKEFHGNFMTLFSTMKSEIAVFMAMKKGSWVFPHIFMKKRFVVISARVEISHVIATIFQLVPPG